VVAVETDKIRVSLGSAVKLGLKRLKVDVLPTTCHLLTYHPDGCVGNCGFCPQSQYTHHQLKDSKQDQEYLSRIVWPAFKIDDVISLFRDKFPVFTTSKDGFQRICIQSLNYERFKTDIQMILNQLTNVTKIPISLALPPISAEEIQTYKDLGVDRICFALDAATPPLFESVKGYKCEGPYTWAEHISLLEKSVEIFGRGRVSTHLIIGLGETEQEALHFIQNMKSKGILTGLFAFYPIAKTRFENRTRPTIVNFRKIQLGRYGIDTQKWKLSDLIFTSNGLLTQFPLSSQELRTIISLSVPFETSGCPGCNRPYYTSSPREEQHNYPRKLTMSEQDTIFKELLPFCRRKIH